MTIDDAIIHAEEIAKDSCSSCAKEHEQLANWLKELKHYRASIKNSGEVTVRELIAKLLKLDMNKPITLIDSEGFEQQIILTENNTRYAITGKDNLYNEY